MPTTSRQAESTALRTVRTARRLPRAKHRRSDILRRRVEAPPGSEEAGQRATRVRRALGHRSGASRFGRSTLSMATGPRRPSQAPVRKRSTSVTPACAHDASRRYIAVYSPRCAPAAAKSSRSTRRRPTLQVPYSARHAHGKLSTHQSLSCRSGSKPTSSATTPTTFEGSWQRRTRRRRSWTSEGPVDRFERLDEPTLNAGAEVRVLVRALLGPMPELSQRRSNRPTSRILRRRARSNRPETRRTRFPARSTRQIFGIFRFATRSTRYANRSSGAGRGSTPAPNRIFRARDGRTVPAFGGRREKVQARGRLYATDRGARSEWTACDGFPVNESTKGECHHGIDW